MTKKHFVRFAQLIAATPNEEKRASMAALVAIVAKEDNAAFDAARFAKACNVSPEVLAEVLR